MSAKEEGKDNLTPNELVVVAGLLGGMLEVTSVLVDKDSFFQVILSSTKKKSKKDDLLAQLEEMDVDDIVAALADRFG